MAALFQPHLSERFGSSFKSLMAMRLQRKAACHLTMIASFFNLSLGFPRALFVWTNTMNNTVDAVEVFPKHAFFYSIYKDQHHAAFSPFLKGQLGYGGFFFPFQPLKALKENARSKPFCAGWRGFPQTHGTRQRCPAFKARGPVRHLRSGPGPHRRPRGDIRGGGERRGRREERWFGRSSQIGSFQEPWRVSATLQLCFVLIFERGLKLDPVLTLSKGCKILTLRQGLRFDSTKGVYDVKNARGKSYITNIIRTNFQGSFSVLFWP